MIKTLLQLAAVASIGAAVGLAVVGRPTVPVQERPVPACQAEDGGPYPCLWDGPTRGNRRGDRVIITRP